MAAFIQDKDRDVIPRWRSFGETLIKREMNSLANSTPPAFAEGRLGKAVKDWQENKTAAFAGELLSTAIMLDETNPAVEDAANFVLKSGLSQGSKDIALRLLGKPVAGPFSISNPEQEGWIGQLRQYLLRNPRDPFAWVDYALGQTIAGNRKKANRAMDVALGLAGNNRFVLRSAARLFVHLDEQVKANDLIRRAAASKHDPWLISAELATSAAAERTPRFAKLGRKMVDNMEFSSFHTSELNAAMGMLEMEHGSNKKAKKSFAQSLVEPTENTVAQVNFAVRRDHSLAINALDLHKEISPEALTYEKYGKGDWLGSVQESGRWFHDQPFSVRPVIHGTYLTASIIEDYAECQRIAALGLKANPLEFGLLNNLSVALARSGELERAVENFRKIKISKLGDYQKITYLATAGMINYRLGHYDLGEQYYLQSIAGAKKVRDKKAEIRAQIFHCRERCDARFSVDPNEISGLEEHIGKDKDSLAILGNLKKACKQM